VRTNRLLKSLLILGVVLLSFTGMYAQSIVSSIIREDAEFWTPLVNPTASQSGNDFRLAIPMQFSFTYDNQNVSNIYAYENGFISINSDRNPAAEFIPGFPNTTNIISWYRRDLFTTGSLSYKFEGTAPFRVLTVQHLGARLLNDFSGNTFDAQIKFYETTNEIKIIYNTVNGFGFSELDGYLYFIGSSTTSYINIKPNAPTVASTFYYGNTNPNAQPTLTENVKKYFYRGRSFTLTSTPKLSGLNPPNNAVLSSGQVYSGDNRPFVRVSRAPGNKDIVIRYTITGPLNTSQSSVIYTAIDAPDLGATDRVNPSPQPQGTGIRVLMPHAKGVAGRLADGALDLTNALSGEYRVDAYLEYLDGTPYSHYATSRFTVAFPADLAILDIQEPIYNPGSIYQFSGPGVPIKFLVKNQGADQVTHVIAKAKVYKENGTFEGELNREFDLTDSPMLFNETRELPFPDLFKTSSVGIFYVEVEVSLRNLLADKLVINNKFPREGDPKKFFEVAYQVEAQALGLSSAGPYYNNRPVRLSARFRNNGVSDISNTFARMQIFYQGNLVYNEMQALKDLPAGLVREVDLVWTIPFIPRGTSGYQVTIEVFADNDEVPANNKVTTNLNVSPGMSGTYSISKVAGAFTTIGDAVTALYERGVEAPVTFLLKDEIYVEGSPTLGSPALDFSSSIIGLDNPNNTVTFTIDPQFATRNTVQIYLYSMTGIGVHFGQSSFPSNNKAPVLNVTSDLVKNYANAPKNIIFDGGPKKSLKFTIGTSNPFRAVFYLGNGASNIQIKNLLIEDGILQAVSNNCRLPLVTFNATLNRFEYDNDNNFEGTYSAGVVVRNRPPVNPNLGVNNFNLDTLVNANNIISGNEIQKFNYGIVTLGIGQLLKFGPQIYTKYYNTNNHYNDNLLYNLANSGIFLGYEKNSEVFRNRIYNIQGGCGFYIAGIAAGGEARGSKFAYNNIGLKISSNEISNVKGNADLFGISIEQGRNDYFNLEDAFSFPDEPEGMKIINNIIWGFENTNPANNVTAIMLATERLNKVYDYANMLFPPKFTNYFSRNDLVTNNTIILGDDGANNTGAVIGISLFNTMGARVYNNAIDIKDPQISVNSPVVTSVMYYGLHPNKGALESNRNAYYLEIPNSSIFRFIETDSQGRILEFGHKTEFATLRQWQNWTGQDWNSVYGDFYQDHAFFGFPPFTLRIKNSPYPLGSILNNRGAKLEDNDVDIDGKMRGEAGEKFDIGAIEFRGRTNGRDGEAVAFLTPGAYKATPPLAFSESEYIMTTAPVAVKTIVRNNGQLPIANQSATLRIYRQQPNGSFVQEGASIVVPMDDIFYSEDYTVDFMTADGINSPPNNYEFFPRTYGELRNQGYVIPDQFKTMEANVTPLYRLEVSLPADEKNANNTITKDIRFYIRKSPVRLLVSAENIKTSAIESTDALDIIAGNLNLDSLKASFYRLGWYINLDLEDPRIDIDIFDRRKWEPRSINYPMYRSLLWVDGHDVDALNNPKRLTRYDRDQITNFLESGTFANKKNLFVSSQEIVRNESVNFADWIKDNLSAKLGTPNNPMGVDGNYNGNFLTGVIIGRDNEFMVRSTDFFGDDVPRVGLNFIDNPGKGITRIGMLYKSHINDIPDGYKVPDAQRIGVLATTYTRYNTILAGVDWRHLANLDNFLRANMDFLEYNEGNIVPVELLNFDAKQVGSRVDINWTTASEINTSKFVVERSLNNETGKNFVAIEELPAAGNSNITNYYGPVVDNKVQFGNSYIYRLKMIDRNGDFEYSDEKIVTLSGINGNVNLEDAMPNPANDITVVEFTLDTDMDVNVAIFDINGKNIHNITKGKLNKGTHRFNVNLNTIPSGSYSVILNSGEIIQSTKLNVVK